ncbi:alpha/beta hydrolase [Blastococcus sp. BMG 814]|uniref:Alpha/beta hydrolase n=1 Tax=Blastococcus carthaginiensis TaxID=3050034 RepID=A0ABT9IA95_9ACTN|nr:alpha/beta hydrolase [Blastococcus carthaginiensis]MDP5182495.1 alpha/beta hydrolase [Blastococcus carthaginiensis]
MRRAYADTRFGQIHYVEHGAGAPVLLLHQTPRSWDEYRDVLPLLGRTRRAIAMDTLGFGASATPRQEWSIEMFAEGVAELCAALGLPSVDLVGHHTGGVVALEVAAAHPSLVRSLVLSGVPFVDADRRRRVAARPPIDEVDAPVDGSHVAALWAQRRPYYPADRPDLLDRLLRDALGVRDRVEEGHRAVNAYRMEERASLVNAPVLVVCGEDDSFSRPDVQRLTAALPDAEAILLKGVGVAAVDHDPKQFATVVDAFLTRIDRRAGDPATTPGGSRPTGPSPEPHAGSTTRAELAQ